MSAGAGRGEQAGTVGGAEAGLGRAVGGGETVDGVAVGREDGIAVVTLDRPAKMNVLDRDGWERLGRVFEGLSADGSLRCVVVRGAGRRAFSAGSDIGSFETQRDTPEQVRRYAASVRRGTEGVWACAHPVVAAVEGVCAGGGVAVAAACDVRVCGESSRFGVPVARLGLTMSYDEMAPALAAMGPGPLLEVLLSGDLMSAQRAREIGLASRIVPDGTAAREAMRLARQIAAGAPLVHRWHKKFVRRAALGTPVSKEEREETYEAFRTDDYREGRAAFLAKRAPRFTGEPAGGGTGADR